jgi:hypothetical protein
MDSLRHAVLHAAVAGLFVALAANTDEGRLAVVALATLAAVNVAAAVYLVLDAAIRSSR